MERGGARVGRGRGGRDGDQDGDDDLLRARDGGASADGHRRVLRGRERGDVGEDDRHGWVRRRPSQLPRVHDVRKDKLTRRCGAFKSSGSPPSTGSSPPRRSSSTTYSKRATR